MRNIQRLGLVAVLIFILSATGGCGGEVELRPPGRDGMFYLDFSEASRLAAESNRYILLDMWRPG